jgi:PKD repeat protein
VVPLLFRSDSAGELEISHIRVSYAVDTTSPTTIDDYDGLWHSADFKITLTAADHISGVKATYYKINEGSTRTVEADGQPSITTEGANNKLEYWSVDKLGNKELPHKNLTGIRLDKTVPSANAGIDQTVNEDVMTTFDASTSMDENGITGYTWTFIDVILQTLTGPNPTYTFATPGTYSITLEVTDPAGNSATDVVIITALDITPPMANAGQDQTIYVEDIASFDASASNDNIAIVSYEWDFGDETAGTGRIAIHSYSKEGEYTVTLTMKDAAGNIAHHSIVVEVLPLPTTIPNTWMIAGGIIAIVGMAIGVAFLLRRRK